MSVMTPLEVLRDAEDMARNYPGDRLRLTGQELLDVVDFAVLAEREACAKLAEELLSSFLLGQSDSMRKRLGDFIRARGER